MNRIGRPLALLLWTLLAGPGLAQAQQPTAQGYQLLTDPQVTGGHLMATRPGTGSATALLVQALKEVAGFFDERPQAVGGARDAADQRAEALFRATLRGSPVSGIAYAIVGGGTGTAGFVFDSPQTIRQSLPRLMQLAGGAGPAPPPALNWREVPFPDGSGSMRLPEGWVITFSSKGMASAKGPHGSIERGVWVPVKTRAAAAQYSALTQAATGQPKPWPGLVADPTDPVTVLQELNAHSNAQSQRTGTALVNILRIIEVAPATPVPGYQQAAYIDYEVEVDGARGRILRFLTLSNVSMDGTWIPYSTYVASPSESFPQNLPVLLEIWASARTAQHVIAEKLDEAVRSLKEVGEIYRQTAQNRERSQDRIHDKWTEVIRGTRIVEDTLTGERRDVDLGYSKEIVRRLNQGEGTDRYREIPLWQLNQ
jgi:hypothetical protein